MRFVPLGDKVLLRREEARDVTDGGIVLPDAAREKPKLGRILSVGDGRMLRDGSRRQLSVHEGDRVLFASYAGTKVSIAGEELLIMSEDEILAVVNGTM